jgi:hypothetical protein
MSSEPKTLYQCRPPCDCFALTGTPAHDPACPNAPRLPQIDEARTDVVRAARNLLLAIDGFLAENEWPDMPFGVHCGLIVLGEKVIALDKAEAYDPVNSAGKRLSEYL